MSFSVNLALTLEWFAVLERITVVTGLITLGIKEDEMRLRDHDPEELCILQQGEQLISSSFSHSDGASSGESLTVLTMTLTQPSEDYPVRI